MTPARTTPAWRSVTLFLILAVAVPVVVKAATMRVAPTWWALYAVSELALLPPALLVTARAIGGRHAVRLVLLLVLLQVLPAPPSIDFHDDFNAQRLVQGRRVKIIEQEGWTQYPDGLGLAPGSSGRLTLRVAVPALRDAYASLVLYRHFGAGEASNSVQSSTDGVRWTELARNVQWDGDIVRLTARWPAGAHRSLLRISADNRSASDVVVVDDVRIFSRGLNRVAILFLAVALGVALSAASCLSPLAAVARDVDALIGRATS